MSGNKTIYLIDDSPLIVTRLRSMLQEVAAVGEVRSAGSFESAVALLAERTPDLVLLDINLGSRSGIDLLQYIRERHPSVIVVMLSNQSSPRHRALCRELGAVRFIDKSTEFGQIRGIISSLL